MMDYIDSFRMIISSHKCLKVSISYIIIFSSQAYFSLLIFDLLYSFHGFPSFLIYIISNSMYWTFNGRPECI